MRPADCDQVAIGESAERGNGGVGRQNFARDRSAMLRICLAFSGCRLRPFWHGHVRARTLCSRTCSLRHQLAILTRPTRTRPRARLRLWDKLLRILARRWCAGWRDLGGHLDDDPHAFEVVFGIEFTLVYETPLITMAAGHGARWRADSRRGLSRNRHTCAGIARRTQTLLST
jgi:hypothetical protein